MGYTGRWKYYQPNPVGVQTIDCTVRAICAVTGWEWDKAHRRLCDYSRKLGTMPSSNVAWWGLLREIGFKRYTLLNTCPDCYTVEDFCIDNPRGVFVLGPHEHAVAVIDGFYYDSWDSGLTVPEYFFEK